MLFGKTKASTLLNILILGALSVGIWFYIRQQIVGEREIEYELVVRVRADNVVILSSFSNGVHDPDTVLVRLKGSKSAIDEIVRSGKNIATITLEPKPEDFDTGAKPLQTLKIEMTLTTQNLKLPPEVEIVSAPTVSFELDRMVTKMIPAEIAYTKNSQAAIQEYGDRWTPVAEHKVLVTGPASILESGNWRPRTNPVRSDQLPQSGKTAVVSLPLLENLSDYFGDTHRSYRFLFDSRVVDVRFEVKEKWIKEKPLNLRVRVLFPDEASQWNEKYSVNFHTGESKREVVISVPEGKKGILTEKNVLLYAVFKGKHAVPGTHQAVELAVVYLKNGELTSDWPEWAKVEFLNKENNTVTATVVDIKEKPTAGD